MVFKIWKESKHYTLVGFIIINVFNRLNEFGYRVGSRVLELLTWREKIAKRETKVLGILYFIHSTVWKSLFGKPADSLEKSTENEDECNNTIEF